MLCPNGIDITKEKAIEDLIVVSIDSLMPHEEINTKNAKRISKAIKQDCVLKNPPRCRTFDFGVFVIDGTHRSFALELLDCKYVVIQNYDYLGDEKLTNDRWLRCVENVIYNNFKKLLHRPKPPLIKSNEQDLEQISFGVLYNNELYIPESSIGEIAYERLMYSDLVEKISGITTRNPEKVYKRPWEIQEHKIKKDMLIIIPPRITKEEALDIAKKAKLEVDKLQEMHSDKKRVELYRMLKRNKLPPPRCTGHILPYRIFGIEVEISELNKNQNEIEYNLKEKLIKMNDSNIVICPEGCYLDKPYIEPAIIFNFNNYKEILDGHNVKYIIWDEARNL